MILFVCVDEQGGILFNRRRVSSDRAVIADILEYIGDSKLYVSEYSAKLFCNSEKLCVTEDCLSAGEESFVFLEESIPDAAWDQIQQVVIYHWNRIYPSDVRFPMDKLHELGALDSSMDFEGNSHKKITREVYLL